MIPRKRSLIVAVSIFAAWLTILTSSAEAQETSKVRIQDRVPTGTVSHFERGEIASESVTLPPSMSAALRTAAIDAEIIIEGFPVAPGRRGEVTISRFDPYADSAKIWLIEGRAEPKEIARSERLHFLGQWPEGRAGVALHLDPATGALSGMIAGELGSTDLESDSKQPRTLNVISKELQDSNLETACGGDALPLPLDAMVRASTPPSASTPAAQLLGTTFEAVIAVDTDNELLDLRFSNNVADANGYLADLFTEMNVFYQRDLSLKLLQGQTFLRVDPDPNPTYDDDPWTVTASPAQSSNLSEFGSYWSSNMGSVDRVFAMLLSGKSSSNFSSSGIAWVDGYCENQSSGGGYSVTQTFLFTSDTVNSGVRLIGHELGHNFGSPHTHCYNPPVDQCFALEGGCYSGAVSCPVPQGNGTIMSYCHFSNGADCGSSRDEFHPTVISLFSGFINNHFPGCIESDNSIFADGFESGDTTAW